jgi:hypothetical protein
MSNVRLTQLGFWSGRTGGLSMTGTDRPNPGALDELGRSITDPGALNGDIPTTTSLDGALPAGDLPLAEYDIDAPRYSYVSVSLNNTATDGNAFGVFVAGANGVDIRGGGFDNSLVDGVTLHRFVTNVVVQATRSTGNGGDGFVLARATTGTILSEVDASRNARNGVTISGLPLASGPTATGTSIGAYGNNAVSNSHAEGNGRYGIEVIGGHDLNVNANDLVGNDIGIVVRGGARAVSVVGNNVTDPTRQGIAVRDGVTDTVVSGNIVSGGETSVYVRASAVEVTRNTLAEASVHGITLVGDAEGTDVQENTISGRGPSAIDYARAESIDPRDFDNELSRWTDTTPWLVTLGRIFQPLNLLWTILGIVVVVTAVRGLRYRGRRAHPYEDKRPVTSTSTSSSPCRRWWAGEPGRPPDRAAGCGAGARADRLRRPRAESRGRRGVPGPRRPYAPAGRRLVRGGCGGRLRVGVGGGRQGRPAERPRRGGGRQGRDVPPSGRAAGHLPGRR